MNDLFLEGRAIHKSYKMGHENLRVLRGASIKVNRGEFLAIMGASGSGKSTLLHILGALDTPDRGSVHYGGDDVFNMSAAWRRGYSNRDVGFIFQFYHLLPELNVLENVLMARMISHSGMSWLGNRRAARRDAQALLDRVGLSERLRHRPRELSGGERQRVAIARALVNEPALLLADEPTGNLDEKIGGGILDLLSELNEGGQAIVMVTHDPRVASRAHRRVQLTDGVIREATKEQVRHPAGISAT